VIEALANVYDAHVYQPALFGARMLDTENELEQQLHGVYDALMSLLAKHQEWCRSARALNKNYMKPALESILSAPAAMQSIIDHTTAMKVVDAILDDSANPGYLQVTAEILRVLREKRSTQLLPVRAKRNFARVHTV
jgi:hypothetical protein